MCEHLEVSHAWRAPVDTQEILGLCLEPHCPDTEPPGSDGAGLAGTLESSQGTFEHFLVNQFLQRAVESLARSSSMCELSIQRYLAPG